MGKSEMCGKWVAVVGLRLGQAGFEFFSLSGNFLAHLQTTNETAGHIPCKL